MKISQVVLWTDVGFMEGSLEVPSLEECRFLREDNVPRGAIASYTDITPSKGRWFTEFKLKGSYTALRNAGYLRMKYDGQFYFGWVDSVELLSDTKIDTTDFSEVLITWHIDQWRTYLLSAVFGYGNVSQRPRGESDPIQNLTARYRKVSEHAYNLIPDDLVGSNAYWAIINYAEESANHETVTSRIIVCPVAKTTDTVYYFKLTTDSDLKRVPTLNQWLLGEYDEIFGIAPGSITSAFISPVPPFLLDSGTGTSSDPFIVVGSGTPTPVPIEKTGTLPDLQKWITGYHFGPQQGGYVSYRNIWVEYSDGTSQEAGSFSTAGVRGGFTRVASGYGYRTIAKQGSSVIYEATETTPVFAISIDDFARNILAEEVFSRLANGSKFELTSSVLGVYASASFSYSSNRGGTGGTTVAELNINVGSTVYDREFTFNNGTFGGYTVLLNAFPSTATYKITTYTTTITASEYGVENTRNEAAYPSYAYLYSKTGRCHEYASVLDDVLKTTDTEQWVVTDMDGSVSGSFPWGLEFNSYTYRCIVSATAAYVQFRFDGVNSSAEGLQFTIPLPALDIMSNSWSDYTYSGQREFDIEQRRIARDQALADGLVSSISGAAQGAMLGGIRENARATPYTYGGKPWREIGGAAGFGALGGVSGLASAGLGYALQGMFNDQLQKASDQLQAKQLDNVITAGNGCDWIYYGRPYQIRSIVPDDYSLERFNASIELAGVEVSEPVSDCTALVTAGGPLRISDLVVLGPIPSEAKAHIKGRLADGVRLVTRSEAEPIATYTLRHIPYTDRVVWVTAETGYLLATTPDNTIPGATLTFNFAGGPGMNLINGTPEIGSYIVNVELTDHSTGIIMINVVEGVI